MTIFSVNKRKYTKFCFCKKKTRQIKDKTYSKNSTKEICRAASKMIEFKASDASCPIQDPIVVVFNNI